MTALSDARLIHVGPASGASGVGDYAQDFLAAVRPYVGQVVEVTTGGPGDDSVRDLRRARRQLKALLRDPAAPPTIVHAELSGGAFVPFWVTRRLRGTHLTATVHDPPWAVWWPWRSRGVARSFLLHHLIHYPTQWLAERVERRLTRGDTLFTMTTPGGEATRRTLRDVEVHRAVHPLATRPDLPDAESRPRAIGVFGYAYRDKGGARVRAVRELLDPSIDIIVAGRGTEDVPGSPGITVLGPVDGPAEDAFFASVQAILVSQSERHSYGRPAYPSSGVINRAISYATPVIWVRSTIDEPGPGLVEIGPDVADMAKAVESLLDDPDALSAVARDVRERRVTTTPDRTAAPFIEVWAGLLA